MRTFTNPLDNIHIASPCSADWNEMFGDDRKRFCGDCKLNVYNLSDMTRREAENLLINSEGRLCVRFFRRSDGTVLTKNCPVGWQAVKQRAARLATAVFSMIAGLFGGVLAFNVFREQPVQMVQGDMSPVMIDPKIVRHMLPMVGQIQGVQKIDPVETEGEFVNGRMTMGKPMIVVKPNILHGMEPRRK